MSELTLSERRVLRLMSDGLSNAAIAEQLRIGQRTLESHVRSILLKLGIRPDPARNSRVLAVQRYLEARSDTFCP